MENDPGGREKVEKQGMLLNTCGFAVGSRERERERGKDCQDGKQRACDGITIEEMNSSGN